MDNFFSTMSKGITAPTRQFPKFAPQPSRNTALSQRISQMGPRPIQAPQQPMMGQGGPGDGLQMPTSQPLQPQATSMPLNAPSSAPVPGHFIPLQAPQPPQQQLNVSPWTAPAGGTPPIPTSQFPSLSMDPGMTGSAGANPQTMPLGAQAFQPSALNRGGPMVDNLFPPQLNPQDSVGGMGLPSGQFSELQRAIAPSPSHPQATNNNSLIQKIVGSFLPTAHAESNEDYNKMTLAKSQGYKQPDLNAPSSGPGMNKYNPVYWGLKGLDSAWNGVSHGLANLFNSLKNNDVVKEIPGAAKKVAKTVGRVAGGKALSAIGDPVVNKITSTLKARKNNK